MSTEQLRKAAQAALDALDDFGHGDTAGARILRAALAQPQSGPYPLPDDLYPGSKDWRSADYAGRVAWLHAMYESARRELDTMYEAMEKRATPPTMDEVIAAIRSIYAPRATVRTLTYEEIEALPYHSFHGHARAAIRAFCKLNGIEVRDE